MKTSFSILFALIFAAATAFVPKTSSSRVQAAQHAIADRIFGLDLFDRNANKYGARQNKKLSQGKLGANSYVPDGMTKQQYEKIRAADRKKKDDRYQSKLKNAFKYTDFTAWYTKRGTDLDQAWFKDANKGHSMTKTKYDWSGTSEAKKFATNDGEKFLASFQARPVTKAATTTKTKASRPKKKIAWF